MSLLSVSVVLLLCYLPVVSPNFDNYAGQFFQVLLLIFYYLQWRFYAMAGGGLQAPKFLIG